MEYHKGIGFTLFMRINPVDSHWSYRETALSSIYNADFISPSPVICLSFSFSLVALFFDDRGENGHSCFVFNIFVLSVMLPLA